MGGSFLCGGTIESVCVIWMQQCRVDHSISHVGGRAGRLDLVTEAGPDPQALARSQLSAPRSQAGLFEGKRPGRLGAKGAPSSVAHPATKACTADHQREIKKGGDRKLNRGVPRQREYTNRVERMNDRPRGM